MLALFLVLFGFVIPPFAYAVGNPKGSGQRGAQLRKLALVPSELELLRSHPKDERGSVREIWAMCPDGETPAFQQAIPHVVVGITPLLKVVIFGSFGESRNGLIWGPEMVPFGDPKWSHSGTRNDPI